jgi:hypothetical protein
MVGATRRLLNFFWLEFGSLGIQELPRLRSFAQ